MNDTNHVKIVGTISRPVDRTRARRTLVLHVRTKESFADRHGRPIDRFDHHRVLAHPSVYDEQGGLAEGDRVSVVGALQNREWEDDRGSHSARFVIWAHGVEVVGRAKAREVVR